MAKPNDHQGPDGQADADDAEIGRPVGGGSLVECHADYPQCGNFLTGQSSKQPGKFRLLLWSLRLWSIGWKTGRPRPGNRRGIVYDSGMFSATADHCHRPGLRRDSVLYRLVGRPARPAPGATGQPSGHLFLVSGGLLHVLDLLRGGWSGPPGPVGILLPVYSGTTADVCGLRRPDRSYRPGQQGTEHHPRSRTSWPHDSARPKGSRCW